MSYDILRHHTRTARQFAGRYNDTVENLTGESVDLTGQPVSRGVHNENLTKCSNLYTPDVLKPSLGGDPIGIL